MSRLLAKVEAEGLNYIQVAAADTAAENSSNTSSTAEHTSTPSESHSAEPQGIAALGIDPIAIGAQFLTFVVLFWIVKKFALDGIVKNLKKRDEDINRGLHLAAEMDKEKAELDAKVEKALSAARKESDAIIAEAHAETGKMIAEAETKANSRAEEILRAAEGRIEREITEARAGLKSEMAGLITEATEAILGEKLDKTNDRKLVESYLKEALK